jgi:transglutaminase-like putative cysteine protease
MLDLSDLPHASEAARTRGAEQGAWPSAHASHAVSTDLWPGQSDDMSVLTVRHVTTYLYRRPVGFGEHRLMLRPQESFDQKVLDFELHVSPRPRQVRWTHDAFGNCVALASFSGKADQLRFESFCRLSHTPYQAPPFRLEHSARTYPFSYEAEELPDLQPLMARHCPDPDNEVHRWVSRFLRQGRPTDTGELLMTLTYAIKESFTYLRRTEKGIQDPALTLRLGRGTCRDFALLMMEAVRSLGFAARFVSGYLYVPSRDGPNYNGGGSTHAWCQVYLPGAGWIEFDPTNGIVGNRDLIRVAVVRDPRQAVPLAGTFIGPAGEGLGMSVEVQVSREDIDPPASLDLPPPERLLANPPAQHQ